MQERGNYEKREAESGSHPDRVLAADSPKAEEKKVAKHMADRDSTVSGRCVYHADALYECLRDLPNGTLGDRYVQCGDLHPLQLCAVP